MPGAQIFSREHESGGLRIVSVEMPIGYVGKEKPRTGANVGFDVFHNGIHMRFACSYEKYETIIESKVAFVGAGLHELLIGGELALN